MNIFKLLILGLCLTYFPPLGSSPVQAETTDNQQIVGRWIRFDGGYTLVFKSVDENGKIDATYLNPRVINVAEATATMKSDNVHVYVELRDRGYPGSNYKLTYDPKLDRLVGIYYHAGLKQNFSIYFEREEIAL